MSFRWPTIIMLLVAGVVLSIIVAWRCAMFSRPSDSREALSSIEAKSLWIKYINAPIRGKGLQGNRFEGRGITEIDVSYESSESSPIYFMKIFMLVRTGWPLRCLERERHYSVDPDFVSKLNEVAAIALPQKLGPIYWGGRLLPLRVLWVGFIFNTLFYALVSGSFIIALRKLRQRIRLDLKHCPNCNYNLCKSITIDGATCSECSHQIEMKLFEQSRLFLRWWMAPMLLPLIAFFFAWILGLVNWYQLRFYLYWEYPIFEWKVLISLFVTILFVFVIAFSAYPDRSAKQRNFIACAVALILSVIGYLPLLMLVVIYKTWPA